MLTREQIIEIYSMNGSKVLSEMLYDTITKYENKINNLHMALDKANKRRKAQSEEINRLLANKQAVSDLKDKYDRLELDYVEMRSSLNKELLEHKAIIKYLERNVYKIEIKAFEDLVILEKINYMKGKKTMNKKIALATMSALIGASIFNDSKYNSFDMSQCTSSPKNKKIPTKRPKSKLQKKSRKQNRNKK